MQGILRIFAAGRKFLIGDIFCKDNIWKKQFSAYLPEKVRGIYDLGDKFGECPAFSLK